MSQIETILQEIFTQVRTTIVLNMRFMDMAVFRLKPVAAPVTLATDGEYLYYHPLWLLKRYRGEVNAVTRDYLHVLLHCVFRHPFVGTLVDSATRTSLDNMFAFCEKVFPEGQELLILVTELTLNPAAARFIGKYGCDAYFRNNKNLLFYERQTEIIRSIDELDLYE